jgi:hypothetical protein
VDDDVFESDVLVVVRIEVDFVYGGCKLFLEGSLDVVVLLPFA